MYLPRFSCASLRCLSVRKVLTALSLAIAFPLYAGPSTNVEGLKLTSTYECISVYLSFSGDSNENSQTRIEYRKEGESAWKLGHDLVVDRRQQVTGGTKTHFGTYDNPYCNQWRGSLVGLKPNTSYEVKVTLEDTDGVKGSPATATIKTRNDVIALGKGATYYVSPQGSDAGAGTLEEPFKTIQTAMTRIQEGDTVYIREGTYEEEVRIGTSGSEENWVTILPHAKEKVTLKGPSSSILINFSESIHHVRIQGLTITGGRMGVNIAKDCSDIVIEDCLITECFDKLIAVREDTSNIVLQRNTVVRKQDGAPGHIIGFYNAAGGGHIVRNNTIKDESGVMRASKKYWDAIGGSQNFQVPGFMAKDSDIYNNQISGSNDDGIETEGGNVNIRIWGNTIEGGSNGYVGIAAAPTMIGPLYVFRNTIYGGRSGALKLGQSSTGTMFFYHNTLHTTNTTAFCQTNEGLDNLIAKNNIICAGRYTVELYDKDKRNYVFDYNAHHGSDPTRFVKWQDNKDSYTTFSAFQTLQQEANGHGIDAATEWVDLEKFNFRLKPTSVLIDSGVVIPGFNDPASAWAFKGDKPDLGAFEAPNKREVPPEPIVAEPSAPAAEPKKEPANPPS
jgi:hypothetical protein